MFRDRVMPIQKVFAFWITHSMIADTKSMTTAEPRPESDPTNQTAQSDSEGSQPAKPTPSKSDKPAQVKAVKLEHNAEQPFAELDLAPQVQEAVEKQGYTITTPIQAMTIPPILAGADVVGQAETGTGKTAAFALPILSRIDTQIRKPQVLVMAPTRELAIQVAEAFEKYGQFIPTLGIATVYGGQHFSIQVNQLKRGAQVVVGTPGRVMDHMRRGQLSLDDLSTLVLDEADEMLRMGFAEDMEWVFSQAPKERQTLLFSATLPNAVRKVAEKYLTDPEHIRAKSKTMTAATVKQRVCCVKYSEKAPTLARILESEVTEGVIVFVKTREMSTRLSESLCQSGYRASALNGDMQQNQRERTVDRLKSGQLDILVATDVAARGLDVERISHVINFDYPHDPEAYVHRIGRTGRAGREGHAILLVTPKEKYKLRTLEKFTRQSIAWMDRPTVESVQAARADKLMAKIEKTMKKNLSVQKELINKFMAAHPEAKLEDVAAAIAAIATTKSEDVKAHNGAGPRRDRKSEKSFSDRMLGRGFRGDSAGGEKFEGKKFNRKDKRKPKSGRPSGPWTKYRIEVGYTHGVKPGNIVGAITSESGLTGTDIGGIDIQTHFTTIDLPQDLTEGQVKELQYLKVAGQALRMSKWNRTGPSRDGKPHGGKPYGKPRGAKKKNKSNASKPAAKKKRKQKSK